MLSVPLMLFRRGGDASVGALAARSKAVNPMPTEWLNHFLSHLTALTELNNVNAMKANRESHSGRSTRQEDAVMQRSGDDNERPASSPCPSSSSSSSSDSSASSSSNNSRDSSSDTEDEAPEPPSANGNGGNGGGDEEKKKKDDEEDEDSSSSDSSADESDQEEDDGVMIDTDDEKDKIIDPTDEDMSESDGSDLENSYPRLPSAPVDTLIAFRQQAAQKELQLTEKLKKEVIADARQRHQERQQSKKKKKKTPQPKRKHSKQSDGMSNGTHLERKHKNGSAVSADVKEADEDEWMVDCSCGLKEKNYDDGTSMIQCDSCSHWVHAKCADKQPETVAQEKFMCFRCTWMFDCVCEVRRRPNHDDGQRMVECESCKTWQHTMCVGIPMTEEPADDYRCPRCVKNARRRKSGSKGSGNRDRQRKRSHSESSRRRRKSSDASPIVAMDVRSAARSIEPLTTPTRAHRSRRAEPKESPNMERKAPLAHAPSPPPVPAMSPPSSPPPPPSSPPPPSVAPLHALSGTSKRDRSRNKRRSERERECSSASSSSSHRNRSGSSPSRSKKTRSHSESSDMDHQAPPPTGVTPSPRGKGLMLRGYSPASARTDPPSSRSMDVRPPLPLTPPGRASSGHNSPGHGGRKRKASSARDRLAKKLKIKKSSLR